MSWSCVDILVAREKAERSQSPIRARTAHNQVGKCALAPLLLGTEARAGAAEPQIAPPAPDAGRGVAKRRRDRRAEVRRLPSSQAHPVKTPLHSNQQCSETNGVSYITRIPRQRLRCCLHPLSNRAMNSSKLKELAEAKSKLTRLENEIADELMAELARLPALYGSRPRRHLSAP